MGDLKCRNCGKMLKGDFRYAYDPDTHKQAKENQYGGLVCSRECDIDACAELESSMPGNSDIYGFRGLSCFAQDQVRRNWPEG